MLKKEKAKEAAKPLPGQIALPTTPVSEKKELPSYGDYCQSEDGKKGYMRGSGGLGSDRVKLVDSEGKFIGYYNRSELKPLKKPETKPTDAPESKIKAVKKPTGTVALPDSEPKKVISLSDLQEIQERRSNRSKLIDLMMANKATFSPNSPRVNIWAKNPGRADIKGIDTPRKNAIPKSKGMYQKGKLLTTRPLKGARLVHRKRR